VAKSSNEPAFSPSPTCTADSRDTVLSSSERLPMRLQSTAFANGDQGLQTCTVLCCSLPVKHEGRGVRVTSGRLRQPPGEDAADIRQVGPFVGRSAFGASRL